MMALKLLAFALIPNVCLTIYLPIIATKTNEITPVLETFNISKQLVYFIIEFNNCSIQQIKPNILDGFRTDQLKLTFNNITVLETNTFTASQIKFIYLDDNGIEIIQANTFVDLPELMTLSLVNNHIHALHGDEIKLVPSLTSLKFYNNRIRKIGKDSFRFFAGARVEIIEFDTNPNIEFEDGAFTAIKWINFLDLANCNISEFSEGLFENTAICNIGLNGNQLNSLPMSLLTQKSLLIMGVAGNNFSYFDRELMHICMTFHYLITKDNFDNYIDNDNCATHPKFDLIIYLLLVEIFYIIFMF